MAQPPQSPQQICQALKGGQFEAPGLIGAGMVVSFHIQDENGFGFALPFYKNRGVGCLFLGLYQTLTLQCSEQGRRVGAVRVALGRCVVASPVKIRVRPLPPHARWYLHRPCRPQFSCC